MIERKLFVHRFNSTSWLGENIFPCEKIFVVFRRIGRDLSMTCAKMEKLTELAKKKSLFDDRTGEVEELSGIIKQVCS